MIPDLSDYYRMRAGLGRPEVEVTEEEFRQIMKENNRTEEETNLQYQIMKGLESSITVGNIQLKLKTGASE